MKRISLTYLVPLVLVLSCSGKDESALVPFTLSAGVEPESAETRAGTDINTRVFELGDTFDVIFGSGVSFPNTTYTVISSGGTDCFVSSPDEPGITSGAVADITDAYYPSGVTSNPGVRRDQSTKAGYKASDYMYGKGKINGGTEPMNNVTINGQSNITLQPSQGRIVFRHMNAKVVVNAAARSDIKIRKIFLAPHDMLFPGESEPGVIMYNNSVGESIVHCAALLPAASSPGTPYTGTFLRIDTNKGSINYSLDAGKYLIAGYVYTLNIDVAQLNTTVGITDWSNAMQPVGDANWE